jgi:hypothetical protein
MSAPAAAWILWPIVALQVVLTISGVLLAAFARSASSSLTVGFALDTVGVAITILAFPVVGALIFWRRPEHPIGWLFCAASLGWVISNFVGPYAMYALVADPGSLPAGELAAWFHTWPQYISIGLLVLLLLLFPDGTLLSPRWRLVVWLVVGMAAAGVMASALASGQIDGIGFEINNPLGVEGSLGYVFAVLARLLQPLSVVPLAAAALSLGLRQRRARGQERQQLKWLTSSVVLVSVLIAMEVALPYVSQSAMPVWTRVFNEVVIFSVALVPVSAGIAILKYRLYNIDVLINRALVYGPLSAMLALIYVGGVVGLQAVVRTISGQESTLAVVASTLVIAALFNPLRRRVQAFVDRRFYRKKYDAKRTLEAFSAKLRDETDLATLNGTLVAVVRETMQPAHVSLWLRLDEPPRTSDQSSRSRSVQP